MRFDNEIILLKKLARGESDYFARRMLQRKIDLPGLTDFLLQEQLALFFLSRLEDHSLVNMLPRNIRERLSRERESQCLRNEQIRSIAARLRECCDGHGIEIMLLKGLPLAERYWGAAEYRFSWDLDILVGEADRDRLLDLLRSRGLKTRSSVPLPAFLWHHMTHAVELLHGDLPVDIHWHFRNRPGYAIDYDAVWRRADTWVLGGERWLIPSAQDELMIMLLGIAQDAERGHCRYRKLWDVYLWLRAQDSFDWPGFAERCRREKVLQLCLNMLALTALSLDCAEEFPPLGSLLYDQRELVRCTGETADAVLGRSRQHLANRLWFARIQATPAWYYLLWWTSTAPLRYVLGRNI